MPLSIAVIDFRRQGMVLSWEPQSGTWTACDVPPALVHGVALIRASHPNVCLFAQGGRLHIQVGSDVCALGDDAPSLNWSRGLAGIGMRRFTVESREGGKLLAHACWDTQGDDFFSWLVEHAANPAWRAASGRLWSEGVEPAALRSS